MLEHMCPLLSSWSLYQLYTGDLICLELKELLERPQSVLAWYITVVNMQSITGILQKNGCIKRTSLGNDTISTEN